MITALIADDESIVLEGIKCIIDWHALGISLIGEAKNGEETLEKILSLKPDLILLDIHMPKIPGTEIVRLAREAEYKGHFIILSGYSDFKYAQTAIRYGVDYYLTKPIDEDELERSVLEVKKLIETEQQSKNVLLQYREKARSSILMEILEGSCDFLALNPDDLHLSAPVYQVVIYERFDQDAFHTSYNFADLMRISNQDHNSFDSIVTTSYEIILLKGTFALQRFQSLIKHYDSAIQKGSPLDALFLAYGHPVYKLEHLSQSYQEAQTLLKRRFFCEKDQHILSYESLPAMADFTYSVSSGDALQYHRILTDYIQAQNRQKIVSTLHRMEKNLYYSCDDITSIKRYLTDIYLQVKQNISHIYTAAEIPFPTNAFIIDLIESKYFLYEIILFMTEQFEMIMNAIGVSGSDNVLDDILYYINHNYGDNLKLESIAHLFGYNSSYLGKIFHKKVGVNFNSYVDKIRIDHSKELLKDSTWKVYEIAERVGYKNVDYFHKKFKKHTGQSPAEYRKSHTSEN